MSAIIQVKKLADAQLRTDPVFAAVDGFMNDIRARAYELFAQRGCGEGHAMEDWLKAEREFSWPAAELAEDGAAYQLRMALPGFSPEQIKVTVTPREIIVSAAAATRGSEKSRKPEAVQWSEFSSREVCRRVELPDAVDVAGVTAALKDGMLTVKAAKQAPSAGQAVPNAVAA